MLTVLQDEHEVDGQIVETATCEGFTVIAPNKATCRLASVLIANGFALSEPTRLVRADPYLFGPPHRIDGITLSIATVVDFFGCHDEPSPDNARGVRSDAPVNPSEG